MNVNKRDVPLKENGEYRARCLKVIISDQLCDSWILVGVVLTEGGFQTFLLADDYFFGVQCTFELIT